MPLRSFQMKRLRLRNRFVLAPMTTYSSQENGVVHVDEISYLARRARAGFGMVITAASYVEKSGHAFRGQWACDSDSLIRTSLRPVAEAIQREGAAAVLQIHHGGRMCPSALCGEPVSASAIPAEHPHAETPRALTEAEIERVIDNFAQAARRAEEAGYDGVEIHGANTYLLQQFVSPHSNRREDRYGQDRPLFSERVVRAVLGAVSPWFLVGYRFSPEEVETPGIRVEHTLELIERLMDHPLAWLHVSLGSYAQGSLLGDFEGPTLAQVVRKIDGRVPLMAAGGVKRMADADAVIAAGCELVAVGKAAITEPEWPRVVSDEREPRLLFPRTDAAISLTLPEGLVQKIYNAPGWFDLEPETTDR